MKTQFAIDSKTNICIVGNVDSPVTNLFLLEPILIEFTTNIYPFNRIDNKYILHTFLI